MLLCRARSAVCLILARMKCVCFAWCPWTWKHMPNKTQRFSPCHYWRIGSFSLIYLTRFPVTLTNLLCIFTLLYLARDWCDEQQQTSFSLPFSSAINDRLLNQTALWSMYHLSFSLFFSHDWCPSTAFFPVLFLFDFRPAPNSSPSTNISSLTVFLCKPFLKPWDFNFEFWFGKSVAVSTKLLVRHTKRYCWDGNHSCSCGGGPSKLKNCKQ